MMQGHTVGLCTIEHERNFRMTPEHDQSTHKKTSHAKTLFVSVVLSLLVGGGAGGAVGYWIVTTQPQSTSTTATGGVRGTISVEEDSATTDVVARTAPAVVSVVLTQDLSKIREQNPWNDLFFGFPFSQPQEGEQQVGAGTGFLVSSDGMIVTNKHVVDAENVDITVVFNDGSEHKATVLGIDPFNDLAVIKIEGKGLPVVELGDSDALTLGQTVIAIGNALGEFRNTVTKGVVSGINRTITAGDNRGASETIEEAIQTDAAINPGNSGGPLLNLAGQVVGINTAVSQQGQLVGFSIPVNVVKQVVESVQKYGKIVRPYLGVRYTIVNEEVKKANNLTVDYGALIIRGSATELAVVPGGPADKAGIEENDILLTFNGKKITQEDTLANYMRKTKVGDTATIRVLHDGKEKDVSVVLEAYNDTSQS
jgi:S1-C subfamily serine protease